MVELDKIAYPNILASPLKTKVIVLSLHLERSFS